MAALDWSQCPAVESIPGKVSGAWVLKGTRTPVSAIFENLEAGANVDDIKEWFDGLDREQVRSVMSSPPAVLISRPLTRRKLRGRCRFFSIRQRLCRSARISNAAPSTQQRSKAGTGSGMGT